jgi:cytidylate kinase
MKITISGNPGAGKGELRKLLSKKLKIPSFSVGDLRREFAKRKNITIQELNKLREIDPSTDKDADKFQQEWASEKKEFILEGRLSYYFIPNSIKIFLKVNAKIGSTRILKNMRETEQKVKSLEEQITITQERIRSDIKRYHEIYQIKNCYDEKNFDIVINTSNLTIKKVLDEVIKKLKD